MSKPTIPEVAERFAAYYRENRAWGSLHVVLDDENFDAVRHCIEYAEEAGDPEGKALAEILLEMSEHQRRRLARRVVAHVVGKQPWPWEKPSGKSESRPFVVPDKLNFDPIPRIDPGDIVGKAYDRWAQLVEEALAGDGELTEEQGFAVCWAANVPVDFSPGEDGLIRFRTRCACKIERDGEGGFVVAGHHHPPPNVKPSEEGFWMVQLKRNSVPDAQDIIGTS